MTDRESVTVLIVGATGHLGGRVVKELARQGKHVRALVRPGSDASPLESLGVEIQRGDMLDRDSLARAMEGVLTVVTTAIGYSRRRKGDSLETVDGRGNRNLIDAAQHAGIERFVFTSVLTCDKAPDVPHFWQKKLAEDYLESSRVPFVSLRPGAFIGGADFWAKGLRKGTLMSVGSVTVPWTYIGIDDVARCIALSVDAPRALGRRIDLGMDRPLSAREVAAVFSSILARPIRVRSVPLGLIHGVAGILGLFNPFARDAASMIEYFLTGQYVADTSLQNEIFGSVPGVEETLTRYARERNLLPA
jgi:uncharacterized protein YbjT (DUF2867 family)